MFPDDVDAEYYNPDLTNIVTPIKPDVLENWLIKLGFDPEKRNFLVQGFKSGFDLCYTGPTDRQSRAKNIPFTVGNCEVLWKKLLREVKLKRVAGPFDHIPFEFYIQSPIGLVPKDAGNETHLIFHLSYDFPFHKSVNHFISDDICMVKYSDLDTAVNHCLKLRDQGAPQIFMSKTDGKSAFRVFPLNSKSWPWLIMMAVNPQTDKVQYFVDKCLPFGMSISCALFQKLSDALKHIIEFIEQKRNFLTNYLDDFLLIARLLAECNWLLKSFLRLCSEVGFPISPEKTVCGTLQLVFLGILMDDATFTLSIPLEKCEHAVVMLKSLVDRKKAKVLELQQLCGFLNFLNRAIFPGWAFTRRMYSKFAGVINYQNTRTGYPHKKLKRHHHVRLDKEFKSDCLVWLQFLDIDYAGVVN